MNSDEVLAVFHPHSDDSGQREGSGLLEGVALVLVPLGYCSVFSATQGLIAVFDAAYGDMFVVQTLLAWVLVMTVSIVGDSQCQFLLDWTPVCPRPNVDGQVL